MTNMKRLLKSTAFFSCANGFIRCFASMDVNLSSADVTDSFVSKEYMPVTFHEDFQFSDNYNYIVEATVVEAFSKLIERDSIFLPYNIKRYFRRACCSAWYHIFTTLYNKRKLDSLTQSL